ncbi:MAG: NrfD/PsrC family molybdoenzyme membrane anchor subunit [Eubacteriales bacterium]
MKRKGETWGWMLAVDFFFAGIGGGMLLIAGLVEMFFGGGNISLLGMVMGPIFIGLGAAFLSIELGKPFQAWRVFMNPKAILTVGAWSMVLAIGFGFIYASFGFDIFPWSGLVAIRKVVAVVAAIFGLIVATYPGILLGRHKSRPFWSGTGMMGLFLLSSIVTGSAAQILSGIIVKANSVEILNFMPLFAVILLGFQFIFWIGYVWIKNSGATEMEAAAAQRWINGDYSNPFKYGFLILGTILPLILLLLPGGFMQGLGALLVLLGGVTMRMMVVYCGEDRTWLPGEQEYRSKLPIGNEEFIKAWTSRQKF